MGDYRDKGREPMLIKTISFLLDSLTHMVGSYPPKETAHTFTTPEEDVPSGAIARGSYTVHSLFTDDDKNEHLKVCRT